MLRCVILHHSRYTIDLSNWKPNCSIYFAIMNMLPLCNPLNLAEALHTFNAQPIVVWKFQRKNIWNVFVRVILHKLMNTLNVEKIRQCLMMTGNWYLLEKIRKLNLHFTKTLHFLFIRILENSAVNLVSEFSKLEEGNPPHHF